MIELTIKQESKDKLDLIQSLWEKLNEYHYENSPHFKNRYKSMTWDTRKVNILAKSQDLAIFFAIDTESDSIVGYCISSVGKDNNLVGEIDSIFIEEKYRKLGIGMKLLQEAVYWLEERGVETQRLQVAVGNEGVIELYKKIGFYPLHVVLQKK